MSAEPARTGPDQPVPGTVIPIFTATRPPRRSARRERTTVPAQPDPNLSPQQKLAASIEHLFAAHGRSLTDEDTAQDYLITLGYVRRMLEGARVKGVLAEDQQRDLDAMIEGMMAAPGLVG